MAEVIEHHRIVEARVFKSVCENRQTVETLFINNQPEQLLS